MRLINQRNGKNTKENAEGRKIWIRNKYFMHNSQ